MNVENLVGAGAPIQVYEDDHIVIFLQSDTAGDVWFHHNLKKFDKTIYQNIIVILEDVLFNLKQVTGCDRMYSLCPDKKILNWALAAGWSLIGFALVNGQEVDIVEYA